MAEELLINVGITGQPVSQLSTDVDRLGTQIDDTSQSMTRMGQATQQTEQRQESLRSQIRRGREELAAMTRGTAEYAAKLAEVAAKQQTFNRINRELRASQATIGQTMTNVNNVVGGLAGGFSVATGVMNLFGIENENAMKSLVKMQALMSITSGLSSLNTALRSWEGLAAVFTRIDKAGAGVTQSVGELGQVSGNAASQAGVLGSNISGAQVLGQQIDKNTQSNERYIQSVANATKKQQEFGKYFNRVGRQVASAEEQAAMKESIRLSNLQLETDKKLEEGKKSLGRTFTDAAKGIFKNIGMMAVYAAIIYAVVSAISFLIKKYNEIPKELELTLKLSEESEKATVKTRETIAQIQHDLDILASKHAGIKDIQLKAIKELMIKEGIATEAQIKNLDARALADTNYFKKYLKKVENNAYDEALIKMRVAEQVKLDTARAQEKDILKSVRQKFAESAPSGGSAGVDAYVDNAVQLWQAGKIPWGLAVTKGLSGEIGKWNDAVEAAKSAKKALDDLDKLTFKGDYIIKPEKVTPTKGEGDKEIKKQVSFNYLQALKDTNKEIKDTISKPDKMMSGSRGLLGEEFFKQALDNLKREYDTGLIDYKTYLTRKERFLVESEGLMIEISDTAYQARKDIAELERNNFEIIADSIQQMLDSTMSITDSITSMYDTRMDVTNQYYDAEQARIEQSINSEENKNKMLADLDKQRYEQLKVDFEKKKQFEKAGVYLNLASGLFNTFVRATSPTAPPSPFNWIAAGLEAVALGIQATSSISAIDTQQLDSPSSTSSSGASSVANIALNPSKTATTSSAENLNMMNKSNSKNAPQSVVKVSDINKVQSTVKTRENNSSY